MQIGALTLQDFEVPTWVTFGGSHRVAVHRSATGQRIVEDLGPDDSDVYFQGVFSGPLAEGRGRALNTLRLSAMPVWLSWSTFRYRVIIRDLQIQYQGPQWIRYSASCLILDQPGGSGLFAIVATEVAADMLTALPLSAAIGVDLGGLQTTLATAAYTPNGSAARLAAIAQVNTAQESIGTLIKAASTNLMLPQPSARSVIDNALFLQDAVSSAGLVSQGTIAGAYLARIARAL